MLSSRNVAPSEQFRSQGEAVILMIFSDWDPGSQRLQSQGTPPPQLNLSGRHAQRCGPSVVSNPVKLTVSINHCISYQRKVQTVGLRPGINLCYSNSWREQCQWEAHSMIRKLFLSDCWDNTQGKCWRWEIKLKRKDLKGQLAGWGLWGKGPLQPGLRKSI